MINYSETPFFELQTEESRNSGIRLLIKREDQNHPFISGNKWWKLKYNLAEAINRGSKTVLTFGGAYSNHIYATAAAANELGLKSIGIIRGEETLPLNTTLTFAKKQRMNLHYVSREEYRKKNNTDFIQSLHDKYGNFYLIPEGGTNELAVKGCVELGGKLISEIEFDYLCLPVGTGGTMAGIVSGFKGQKEIIGFSSLKGGSFLHEEVEKLQRNFSGISFSNWRIETQYHFGGYAKVSEELKLFIRKAEDYSLPLDPVYTSKMFYGVLDLMKKNYFRSGTTILLLHTGGLQGRAGFNF